MFTGIIETTAPILDIENGVFTIENLFTEPLQLGQSIAHDGACMTVTDMGKARRKTEKSRYSFFAMEETFSKTNF
jgi:riboflavin synthase